MKLRTLLLLFTLGMFAQGAMASNAPINTEDRTEGVASMDDMATSKTLSKKELRLQKKMLKKQERMEKRMAKLEKFLGKKLAKKAMDFNDPVDKWFWFWILGWAAGLLLSILAAATIVGGGFGVFWLLASLAWLFGTISLVIWLVKKFG